MTSFQGFPYLIFILLICRRGGERTIQLFILHGDFHAIFDHDSQKVAFPIRVSVQHTILHFLDSVGVTGEDRSYMEGRRCKT